MNASAECRVRVASIGLLCKRQGESVLEIERPTLLIFARKASVRRVFHSCWDQAWPGGYNRAVHCRNIGSAADSKTLIRPNHNSRARNRSSWAQSRRRSLEGMD